MKSEVQTYKINKSDQIIRCSGSTRTVRVVKQDKIDPRKFKFFGLTSLKWTVGSETLMVEFCDHQLIDYDPYRLWTILYGHQFWSGSLSFKNKFRKGTDNLPLITEGARWITAYLIRSINDNLLKQRYCYIYASLIALTSRIEIDFILTFAC